jgi:D-sedoheptulose 7-phosphate isomerase
MVMNPDGRLDQYFTSLNRLVCAVEAQDRAGAFLPPDQALEWFIMAARRAHAQGGKLMFIGNGGSAGIASHMAIDYAKNGGLRSLAFNDAAALTCLGNDIGYEQVFAHQVGLHGRSEDLLVAISSSGRSPSILNAVKAGHDQGCTVFTLSGFNADNPLRRIGDVNLYVPSGQYGFVEITHLALLHAALDIAMGWSGRT